ncbi:class I SAM-dependent methyltransferase [Paenibacillus aceris]|uniref:SAM-dependent methyltransferase n=1 Tax=Paenibacillus aceris TaxID=869555 RepID=A0ABS4HZG6_9BACL|nr:class I SAM-dependent methyltransferase [Paenibacillus aceris]MBP1964066.1 SAM-dependent methyltransferase [Paenibacillus aceris]NHW34519.1 methyltransferase domain-containing protein [Paenibacillus aceris]
MDDKNDKTKRLSVYLPEKVKADLERMAEETGLSMTQLIVMATHGLLANYSAQGGAIFADLLAARQRILHEVKDKQRLLNEEREGMQEYYGARAVEYERIYHREDEEFQRELAMLADIVKKQAAGSRVLEVACGTGYWTQFIAETAKHIVGVDIRPEVLQIAESKPWPLHNTTFVEGDAYRLSEVQGAFDFGFANFWFSHIPKNRLDSFLQGFHERLGRGARVFMADNVYVPGRGGELITLEHSEDTYKRRELADGSKHEIIKNYYSYEELNDIFKPLAENLRIFVGSSFWYVSYTVA